jgi:hypothetical protein
MGKASAEVVAADVLAFVTAQYTGEAAGRLQPVDAPCSGGVGADGAPASASSMLPSVRLKVGTGGKPTTPVSAGLVQSIGRSAATFSTKRIGGRGTRTLSATCCHRLECSPPSLRVRNQPRRRLRRRVPPAARPGDVGRRELEPRVPRSAWCADTSSITATRKGGRVPPEDGAARDAPPRSAAVPVTARKRPAAIHLDGAGPEVNSGCWAWPSVAYGVDRSRRTSDCGGVPRQGEARDGMLIFTGFPHWVCDSMANE